MSLWWESFWAGYIAGFPMALTCAVGGIAMSALHFPETLLAVWTIVGVCLTVALHVSATRAYYRMYKGKVA